MVNKSKKAVKDALLEMMKEKPYNQITVHELIKHAGISRGTFYTHFSNIDDVRQQLIDDLFSHADTLLSGHRAIDIAKDPYPTLLMATKYICKSIEPARMPFKYFNVYDLCINLRNWLSDFILSDEDYVAYLGGEAQAKIYVSFVSGGLINAYNMWLTDSADIDAEFIAKIMSDILTGSLKTAFK